VTATRLTKKLRLVEGGGARLLGLGARPPVRLLRPRGRGGGHARGSSGARETRRGRSKAAATRDCGDGEGRRTSGSGRRWQGRRRHGVSSGLGLSGGRACLRSSRPAAGPRRAEQRAAGLGVTATAPRLWARGRGGGRRQGAPLPGSRRGERGGLRGLWWLDGSGRRRLVGWGWIPRGIFGVAAAEWGWDKPPNF